MDEVLEQSLQYSSHTAIFCHGIAALEGAFKTASEVTIKNVGDAQKIYDGIENHVIFAVTTRIQTTYNWIQPT